MPLKNKTFLSNICLYTFLILGGGCTDEAGMENIGNTDRRIPLTISATVSRYTAIDKKNTSVTRTPIENDYTTEFSDGDGDASSGRYRGRGGQQTDPTGQSVFRSGDGESRPYRSEVL